MTLFSSSGRRPRLVAGGVMVLVVVAAALFAVLRDRGDGLGGVRGQDVVAAAQRTAGDSVVVDLRPGARRAAVLAALDELPEEARWVNVRLGRVDLDLDRATGVARAALVDQLLAAAAVRAPAVSIELSRRSGISARVQERGQAAPLVLELAERVPQAQADGVDGRVGVEQVRSSRPGSIVFLELGPGRNTEAALAAVRAAQALEAREPTVAGGTATTELRLQASSIDDAAAAWREAGRALDRAGADDELVEVAVDRTRTDGTQIAPIISGPASRDAGGPLALVRRLDEIGSLGFATTDLSFARVLAPEAADARAATRGAAAAGIERFRVSWTSASSDTAWMGLTAGLSRRQTSVEDDPGVVARLLGGAARARAEGIRGLHWDRQASDGVPRLRLARPSWLPVRTDLADEPAELRRLVRAIRAIGWPGVARFDVITGPGSCTSTRAAAVVRITSTSSGRARKVEAGSSCTDDAAVEPIRTAWDAER